jgi:hypothetical protein
MRKPYKTVKFRPKNSPKGDFLMHHKAIKAQIRKQLKIRYPNWHRVTKKEKKAVAKKVLDEGVANYDFKQEVTTPVEELLGINTQLPTAAIMNFRSNGAIYRQP